MSIISYNLMGRFGNNLFQYIATKIIQNKLLMINKEYAYNYNTKPENSFIINDKNFFDILNDIYIIPINQNVYLDGYFQFDKHIRENKKYVLSILNENNIEKINDNYTVSQFYNKIYSFNRRFRDNEVLIHLRLNDFLWENVCINYMQYVDIINNLPSHINKIIIIVDKCRDKWELDYLNIIYLISINKNLIVQIESGDDLLEDFCKMYYSINFLSSNSTLSYLAGLLGEHKLTWCINNKIRYPHQCVEKFNDNTISLDAKYLPYP
jgi:hypothetical protein